MRLLALDTATLRATVAVCAGQTLLAEGAAEVTTHSANLLSLIDEVLARAALSVADLDGIVCGAGPGSFTGLRIGLATAKGLCFAASKPLLAPSTLDALAEAAREHAADELPIVALLDARRNELYGATYAAGSRREEIWVLPPSQVSARVVEMAADGAVLFVGDGAQRYRGLLGAALPAARFAPEALAHVQARWLVHATLARALRGEFDDLRATVPLYVRAPDIRLPGGAPA